ncbi:MAG: hypothetical protein VB934_20015, partial [Polyangiaceae bacterium]
MTNRESDKPSIPAGVLDEGAGRPEDDALIDSLFGDEESAESAFAGETDGEEDVTVPLGAIEVRTREGESEAEAVAGEEYLDDLSEVELLDGELGESPVAPAVDFYDAVRPLSQAPLTESE